jgi:beta-lactamase regulating signal transducer with metallopeptidase domain
MLGGLAPGGTVAGWVATAAAVAMALMTGVGIARTRRAYRSLRAERWVGQHLRRDDYELVVLPVDDHLALAIAGSPDQVVISQSLVAALSPEQLDAVLRHERAHLAHRHQRFLILASGVDHCLAFLRPVRRSTAALRAALERWADEVAAGETGDRRAVLRDALLFVTGAMASVEAAAFSAPETLMERITALDGGRPSPSGLARGAAYTSSLALGLATVAGLAPWLGGVHMVVVMAGRCPL